MPHPGAVLQEEFMDRHTLSQYRVAVDIGVPPRRINEIVLGKRGISADTALRLARYFGNDPRYWMRLQTEWELAQAEERAGESIEIEVKVFDPAKPPPRRGRPPRILAGVARVVGRRRPREPERGHLFVD